MQDFLTIVIPTILKKHQHRSEATRSKFYLEELIDVGTIRLFFSVIKFSSIQIENIRCQAKEKTNDCYKLLYGIKIAIDVKRISNLVCFQLTF